MMQPFCPFSKFFFSHMMTSLQTPKVPGLQGDHVFAVHSYNNYFSLREKNNHVYGCKSVYKNACV